MRKCEKWWGRRCSVLTNNFSYVTGGGEIWMQYDNKIVVSMIWNVDNKVLIDEDVLMYFVGSRPIFLWDSKRCWLVSEKRDVAFFWSMFFNFRNTLLIIITRAVYWCRTDCLPTPTFPHPTYFDKKVISPSNDFKTLVTHRRCRKCLNGYGKGRTWLFWGFDSVVWLQCSSCQKLVLYRDVFFKILLSPLLVPVKSRKVGCICDVSRLAAG